MNEELPNQIFDIIGPADNIEQITNCMTRLRVHLKNEDEGMHARLKALDGVLGINPNGSELQIVLGPGRAQSITASIKSIMAKQQTPSKEIPDKTTNARASAQTVIDPIHNAEIGDGKALHEAIRKKNATPMKLMFRKIAHIFLPLIPAFIACGLITGLLNISLKLFPELQGTPVAQILAVMGSAVIFGMNLFVGVRAAAEFGGTPIMGGVLAAVISNPALSGISIDGWNFVPGRGGIIAVILVAALGSWLEKRLHRIIPEMFDLFVTPLIILLSAGFAALFVLQPIGGIISEGIGTAASISIGTGGAFTGFLLGGTFLPMVMLGIHQALTPIHAELIARDGVTILLPVLAMAGCGQIGASLAVYCKTKNHFLKKTILSALPVGLMGVGEPLIYGVTLPLGRPFIGACIGGAAGGAIVAANYVGAAAMGISGLPLAAVTDNIPAYLLGLVCAYAVGFIATWLIGFDDPEEKEAA